MKLTKGIIKIYTTQFVMMFATLVLVLVMYNIASNKPMLFSTITTLVFLGSIYSSSWRIGRLDSRKIPGYFPDKKLAVKLALSSIVLPIILLLLKLIFPDALKINLPFMNGSYDFFIKDFRVFGTFDLIYKLWFFPYGGFVKSGNLIVYILEMLPTPIIIYLGYIIGIKRFSIIEYFYAKIVFSNKVKNKKRKKENNLFR